MSGSVRLPTEREIDLQLYNKDYSYDQLFIPEAFDGWVVLSPLLLIGAALVAILFAARVVSLEVALEAGGSLGGFGIVGLPFAIGHIYFFHCYRNRPLSAEKIKEKLLYEKDGNNLTKNVAKAEKVKQIAATYNIALE
jgi:hypothetical protein